MPFIVNESSEGESYFGELITEYGPSTAPKPVTCADGSVFIETDTQKVYMFDETNKTWREW